MPSLDIERIRQAYRVTAATLPTTPLLLAAPSLHAGELWVKCESLQPTGSFKIRGATFRISRLTARERLAGVVAYSTGNHAQAVAKAAADAGIATTIIMSPDVPAAKVEATERWGARVIMADATSAGRRALAEEFGRETGATLIPPYDDFDVMAGQGTIVCELAEQLGSLAGSSIFVPIGGGGLIAGVAAAAKAIEPACRVVGVEPELENDAALSFRAGHIVTAAGPSRSIADAIKVQAVGKLTFPIIQEFVDDIVTVTESQIEQATIDLFDHMHLVVEPAGAVAFAAARHAERQDGERRIALLCGGNISRERLCALHASR